MIRLLLVFLVLTFVATFASAQDKKSESQPKKNISAFTEKLQKINGFMPLYLNAEDGKRTPATGDTAAHYRATLDDIERFLTRPDAPRKQTAPLPAPPDDPIGAN